MVEDTKIQENSAEATLSAIQETAATESADDVIDLTETEMVSAESAPDEELIDIKAFDETGVLNIADEESKLAAMAQHGDDDAIAEFSKSITEQDAAVEEKSEETKPSGQDDIDAMLDNIGQVAEEVKEEEEPTGQDDIDTLMNATAEPETTEEPKLEEDLSEKAEMLESASKTYAEKDFSESTENVDTDADADIEPVEETAAPVEASMDDIAAAMADVAPQEVKAPVAEKEVIAEPAPVPEQVVESVTQAATQVVTEKVALKAIPTATGLQVGFPVEVLAEALRPMVAGWVAENLPTVVEKLVKEELSKLADK